MITLPWVYDPEITTCRYKGLQQEYVGNCREIISLGVQRGCCYFDLEYEICRSSKVSSRKRRMRNTGRRNDQLMSHESEEKGIAL
jgi:hypothetical protein